MCAIIRQEPVNGMLSNINFFPLSPSIWRAKPLVSYEVMLELLNHTTTKTGLTVTVMQDTNTYNTGIKITDKEMKELNIQRDDFHGDWNYTIKPETET